MMRLSKVRQKKHDIRFHIFYCKSIPAPLSLSQFFRS